ncbi:MAG: hypothetical protein J3Q66DRAFT_92140 [Benniella sp.]|nr:MAG: hypothetical protein J3Q66DRAFT_92140 [Benniella sp.]
MTDPPLVKHPLSPLHASCFPCPSLASFPQQLCTTPQLILILFAKLLLALLLLTDSFPPTSPCVSRCPPQTISLLSRPSTLGLPSKNRLPLPAVFFALRLTFEHGRRYDKQPALTASWLSSDDTGAGMTFVKMSGVCAAGTFGKSKSCHGNLMHHRARIVLL